MADITNKNIQIPGVNSDTNYVQERAYMLNMNTNADIAAVGTHKIVALPEGEALVGLKVIVVEGVTGLGYQVSNLNNACGQTFSRMRSIDSND
jgi:hypothetical protein